MYFIHVFFPGVVGKAEDSVWGAFCCLCSRRPLHALLCRAHACRSRGLLSVEQQIYQLQTAPAPQTRTFPFHYTRIVSGRGLTGHSLSWLLLFRISSGYL